MDLTAAIDSSLCSGTKMEWLATRRHPSSLAAQRSSGSCICMHSPGAESDGTPHVTMRHARHNSLGRRLHNRRPEIICRPTAPCMMQHIHSCKTHLRLQCCHSTSFLHAAACRVRLYILKQMLNDSVAVLWLREVEKAHAVG